MNQEVKYAGFWTRFLANILDCLLLISVGYIIRVFFPVLTPIPDFSNMFESGEGFSQLFQIWTGIWKSMISVNMVHMISGIACLAYFVVMIGRFGATVGKMAVGIKVVREDLQPLSYGTVFVREVLIKNMLFIVIFFISWLGYLWIAWDKKKQGWHDKIARTLVIKEEKESPLLEPK